MRILRPGFFFAVSALFGPAFFATQSIAQSLPPQTPETRRGAGDTSIFAPLTLHPGPNSYRTASGAPGPKYWQNDASYDLHATLDTAHRTVRGSMTLRYTNHSPDTLHYVWILLEQNIFREQSLSTLVFPAPDTAGMSGFQGGDVIETFTQRVNGRDVPLTLQDHGTIAKIDLVHPLAPGQTATLNAAWHFAVPDHGAIRFKSRNGQPREIARRMARDGTLYEIAQWYPRVCVYDDVKGWNTDPYLGLGEFYLEYGNYTLSVTVPAGYIVAATGTLDNPTAVLTATQRSRLSKAAHSSQQVAIITADELTNGTARPKKAGTLTWRFHANHVRDAAWAAAPDYQWDATSWHGILAQSYYRPTAANVWKNAADMARMSIEEYSTRWYPYPYPQISAVEGHVYGMEYPMLAMESSSSDSAELYSVITHEVGHNWFPMVVGSNERVHYWQDEGFNTLINTFSEARRFPAGGDQAKRAGDLLQETEQTQVANIDYPIEFPADRTIPSTGARNYTEYTKTGAALQILRNDVLGPEAFDDAFRTYTKRWAFKHPTPTDFFRTMEDVGGRRLDWFWREFFFTNAHFDQAIDTVATRQYGDTFRMAVRYSNLARGVLPLRARFTFNDGTTQDFVYPAEVWSTDSKYYVRHYAFDRKTVTRIELDPDHRLLDVDRGNNVWQARK